MNGYLVPGLNLEEGVSMKELAIRRPISYVLHRPEVLAKGGCTANMRVCQFEFPNEYADNEVLIWMTSDQIWQLAERNTSRVYSHYAIGEEKDLEYFARTARHEEVFNFLKSVMLPFYTELLTVEWTGYRILGTVSTCAGPPAWRFELFARDPRGTTRTYTEI